MIFKSPITRPKLHWAAPRRQTLPSSAASPCRDNTLPTSSTKKHPFKKFDNNNDYFFNTHILFYFLTSLFQEEAGIVQAVVKYFMGS
jgi:hypothetical protein